MLERYRITHWGLTADSVGEVVKYADAQATIADLQGQLLEWKRALHSLTPGGSEYANDSKACVEWVREARSRQHEAIIDGVKQRKDLQQRVAQLEGECIKWEASCNLVDAVMERNKLKAELATLQADHARVLGLVQALDGRFWNYEQKMCDRERAGLTKEQRTGACIVLHWLNEQIKAASLPAQRAKLAQGGAVSKPVTTCNRHSDCDAADEKARAKGALNADHCHDDCCSECFGN